MVTIEKKSAQDRLMPQQGQILDARNDELVVKLASVFDTTAV